MPELTSGETVEQVAYDVAHMVLGVLISGPPKGELSMTRLPLPGVIGGVHITTLSDLRVWLGENPVVAQHVAETIAARIREHTTPRRITRIEELSGLPVGAVIRATGRGHTRTYEKHGHDDWRSVDVLSRRDEDIPGGNVIVLWEETAP